MVLPTEAELLVTLHQRDARLSGGVFPFEDRLQQIFVCASGHGAKVEVHRDVHLCNDIDDI